MGETPAPARIREPTAQGWNGIPEAVRGSWYSPPIPQACTLACPQPRTVRPHTNLQRMAKSTRPVLLLMWNFSKSSIRKLSTVR